MPDSFSVNQLKTWEKCQKKYAYDYILKLAWPANPKNFRLGKGVHQLLDYTARQLPVAPIAAEADSDIVAAWRVLAASKWSQYPVIASEWGFSLALDGRWFYGRIDRIVQVQDKIHILDWKTGTSIPFPADEDWQTVLYLYALYESRHEFGLTALPPESFVFTYVQVNQNQVKAIQIPYNDTRHQATRTRVMDSILRITQQETYSLPPSCLDSHCPYRRICGIESHMAQMNGLDDSEDFIPEVDTLPITPTLDSGLEDEVTSPWLDLHAF